ncbi:unnamed protein product [Sphenostylis stenocarpa]|uniref:Uncharacterized protein n=1 Tax=Sphenostylis stenocarpa TaxID=92480 RepID=A0AA86VPT4_9FABA|nr:unnamed protein product [Sphenostylis stenocarpa]
MACGGLGAVNRSHLEDYCIGLNRKQARFRGIMGVEPMSIHEEDEIKHLWQKYTHLRALGIHPKPHPPNSLDAHGEVHLE